VKVVYVSSLDSGGPVSHLYDLAPAVAELGPQVRVLCGSEQVAASFRKLGLESTALPLGHKLDLRAAATFWPELRRADIVHTHDRRAGLLVRPQVPLVGARPVHTLHGVPDEIFGLVGRSSPSLLPEGSTLRRLWLLHGLLRLEAILSRIGTLVVPSDALARFLTAHGFSGKRMVVIPNGIRVERREPPPFHDPPVLGTAAILIQRKGVDVLLDACARLRAPVRLSVFGDGPLRGMLEDRAGRLGVHAVFHGHASDARSRLAEIDIFVLASRGENMPIAILEAMALAVPVVATRVGGVPELVVDNLTGVLVEPDDVDSLAAALDELLADPSRAANLGRAGAERAGEEFDQAKLAACTVELYERLLEQK
jgi:glycosyltransferase involved in cell wall biosynthesis